MHGMPINAHEHRELSQHAQDNGVNDESCRLWGRSDLKRSCEPAPFLAGHGTEMAGLGPQHCRSPQHLVGQADKAHEQKCMPCVNGRRMCIV